MQCIFTIIFFAGLLFYKNFSPYLFAGVWQLKEIQELEKPMEPAPSTEAVVRPRVEYDAGNLRDPFTSLIATIEKVPGSRESQNQEESKEFNPPVLTVRGIIWGGKFPQAIINDKVVKAGDTIEGAQVIDIKKEGITCFFQGRQFNVSSPAINLSPQKNTKER